MHTLSLKEETVVVRKPDLGFCLCDIGNEALVLCNCILTSFSGLRSNLGPCGERSVTNGIVI
jgi:hypothetical protein